MAVPFSYQMPALEGNVITQRHTDYCKAHGHAVHSFEGLVSDYCPRCGKRVTGTVHVSDLAVGDVTTDGVVESIDLKPCEVSEGRGECYHIVFLAGEARIEKHRSQSAYMTRLSSAR